MKKAIIILVCFRSFTSLVNAQCYCEFVERVQAYQQSVNMDYKENQLNFDSSFTLDGYLSLFDHMKIAPGLKAYVSYDYGLLSGEPLIYVLPFNFNLKDTIRKRIEKVSGTGYLRSKLGLLYEEPSPLKSDTTGNYEDQQYLYYTYIHAESSHAASNIIPGNSKEGFLQYLFFNIMGEQFGLFWHSLLFQKRIICSEKSLKEMIKEYSGNNLFEVEPGRLESLYGIDPSIEISYTNGKYLVRWYELETHNGFFRRSYEIDSSPPYTIRLVERESFFDINLNFSY